MKDKISLTVLPGTDTLVIRKDTGSNVFILTGDSVIISKKTYLTLLNHMVRNKIIPISAVYGILEENTE